MWPIDQMQGIRTQFLASQRAGLSSDPLRAVGGMIQTKTCLEFFIKFVTQDLALSTEIQPPSRGFVEPKNSYGNGFLYQGSVMVGQVRCHVSQVQELTVWQGW